MKEKLLKNNKGITLISLIVTIIVILILAGVSLASLTGENGIITRAQDAAEKYKEAEDNEKKILGNHVDLLNFHFDKSYKVDWEGEVTGTEGVIATPIPLNDSSRRYVVTVKSNLYEGDILLNIYGFTFPEEGIDAEEGEVVGGTDKTYMACAAVDSENTYMIEIREFLLGIDDKLDDLEGTTAAILNYNGNTNEGKITYDPEILQSELTITKIVSAKKTYTGFAKLLSQMTNGHNKVNDQDLLDALQWCYSRKNLGYNILNTYLSAGQISEDGEYEDGEYEDGEYEDGETDDGPDLDFIMLYDEELERELLKEMLYKPEIVDAYENILFDQISMHLYAYFLSPPGQMYGQMVCEMADENTFVDWFAENDTLNDFNTRVLGSTYMASLYLTGERIMHTVNAGVELKNEMADPNILYYMPRYDENLNVTNVYCGKVFRDYANYLGIVNPLEDNKEYSLVEQMELEELTLFFLGADGESGTTDDMESMDDLFAVSAWYYQYTATTCNEDAIACFMWFYPNNIKLNHGGVRMVWNAFMHESSVANLFESKGKLTILRPYNLRNDTKYIELQKFGNKFEEFATMVETLLAN